MITKKTKAQKLADKLFKSFVGEVKHRKGRAKGLQPWMNISGLTGQNGQSPWNKGLTKGTDKRVASISNENHYLNHRKYFLSLRCDDNY